VSKQTVEIEDADNGDILAPLKRLHDRYEAKSEELAEKVHGDNAADKLRASKFYIQAAADITKLIEQNG
jgi:hypothetical protein